MRVLLLALILLLISFFFIYSIIVIANILITVIKISLFIIGVGFWRRIEVAIDVHVRIGIIIRMDILILKERICIIMFYI